MRFSVCHETHYRYSAPVLFAPHVLRLTPRSDNAVLLTHSLTIDPVPSIRQDVRDRHGNTITRVEFGDPSGHLSIESRFELETRATQVSASSALPPLPWPSGIGDAMVDYLPPVDHDESVR